MSWSGAGQALTEGSPVRDRHGLMPQALRSPVGGGAFDEGVDQEQERRDAEERARFWQGVVDETLQVWHGCCVCSGTAVRSCGCRSLVVSL